MHSSSSVDRKGSEIFEMDSQRTLYPYVTGTSVIGIKYKDGILMAADMGGSYGSTLRYKSVERMKPVGKHSLLGASGEISDFQEILRYLDELILYDNMWDDGNSLGPKEVHNYLNRLMYNRRNKFNPLWNSLVLGGVKNGQKYLGMVSIIGIHFEDNHVATGFGNHLARPILRDEWREDMSYEEGVKLLEKCMLVLLYRDRSAINKLQIAKITEEGVSISPPYALKTFWKFSAFQNPAKGAEGSCINGFYSSNRHVGVVDWQEEAYQKIISMKEMYLPELNELYQKTAIECQQHDALVLQPKQSDPIEKRKLLKGMLERVITFLQVPKSNISPAYKDKLALYEKQIISLLSSNRHKKPASSSS